MKNLPWIITIIVMVASVYIVWDVEQKFKTEETDVFSISVIAIHETDDFFNIQAEYPQFKETNEEFNKKISELFEEKIADFKKAALENWDARIATAPDGEEAPENPSQPFDFISTWEPSQLNENYISFVVRLYYYVGGAHGANEVFAFNYDISKEKEISMIDFLGGSEEDFNKLAELSEKDVSQQLQSKGIELDDFLMQMVESGTEATQDNYENFTFNYNSLKIYFEQYQVAPGAVGSLEVVFYKPILTANTINSSYLK